MAGGESRLGMRVMYMIGLNHGLAQKSTTILHAYKLAENPRKPAQSRAFAHKDPRKFRLKSGHSARSARARRPRRAARMTWRARRCFREAPPPFVEAAIPEPTQAILFVRHHGAPCDSKRRRQNHIPYSSRKPPNAR